jgi:hypothetical protein
MTPGDRVKKGDDIVNGTAPRLAVGERASPPGSRRTPTAPPHGGGASVGEVGGALCTRSRRSPSESGTAAPELEYPLFWADP